MPIERSAELGAIVSATNGRITLPASAETDQLDTEAEAAVDAAMVTITDVVQSTDEVTDGALFCCIVGARVDGHDLAATAVRAGAVAVLSERALDVGVPCIVVDRSRPAMALAAAELFGQPASKLSVVGITGTNGKTTVTHLLASILGAARRQYAILGTLSGARTTPASPDLQRFLAEAVADECDAVAMEVSSHGLMQDRVTGTEFAVGVFTNLGRDHLDYHGTQEEYFEAKARLFRPGVARHGVVNADDDFGRRLIERALIDITPFSFDDLSGLELTAAGSRFRWNGVDIVVPFPGRFNVSNALAAATTAQVLGVSLAEIAEGLASTPPVQGRFHRVDEGQDFAAIVDFAHTPDALDQALRAGRELTDGQVIVVFGCGGDRDKDKRPEMGAVAGELADVVVVTSDNPRSEPPAQIIDQILGGIPASVSAIREPDRQMAISVALSRAQTGDLVLIAGKGHETTQTIGDTVVDFDDVSIVGAELKSLIGPGRASIE